jgi:hypothetical protein
MRVYVAHAAWAPGRKDGLRRILEAVPDARVVSSVRREHASTWAVRLWEHVARDEEPVACLNDDVTLHPEFVAIVEAMIEAVGKRPLGLLTNNPAAPPLQAAGHHWLTCYWLTGPAYVLWPEHAASILEWYARAPASLTRNTNEDNWAIHWAWDRQEPIWSCIPGIVEHDTSIPSTLGYDGHPNRTTAVPWGDEPLTDPAYWWQGAPPPWVPNPWMSAQAMAAIRRWVRGGIKVCEMCCAEPAAAGTATSQIGLNCLRNAVAAVNGRAPQ